MPSSTTMAPGPSSNGSVDYLRQSCLVPIYILVFLSARYLLVSFDVTQLAKSQSKTSQEIHHETSIPKQNALERKSNVIYGHIHMAKTGGTSINGQLASQFERVCGNKGYSFNAYQANMKKGLGFASHAVMKKWGFEDCDYISMETGYHLWPTWESFWKPHAEFLSSLNLTLELHVPCRDPLEHLMSMCNHNRRKFNCDAADLESEFVRCTNVQEDFMKRFSLEMKDLPNTSLKCFNPIPIEPYIDYMGGFLQRKRIPHVYWNVSTNLERHRATECIWKNATVQNEVLQIMREKQYFKFCEGCLGSENDLLFSS